MNNPDLKAHQEHRATPRMWITSILFWSYLILSSPILWFFAV